MRPGRNGEAVRLQTPEGVPGVDCAVYSFACTSPAPSAPWLNVSVRETPDIFETRLME